MRPKFFGVAPEHALMVGDSVSDVKAARARGFQIACMSYGYNHGVDIAMRMPDAVIDAHDRTSAACSKQLLNTMCLMTMTLIESIQWMVQRWRG